ncbi:MAG: CocE/NonD family hydrolase, partial [Bacteroidota bacterium]
MKRRLLFLWLLTGIATGAIAQTNNNGELDQISELTTTVEIPITMPDGIKLMTNITVPVTSDAMTADIDFGSGTPSNVELIPSGLPLICYDNVNGAPNPNPQQLPLILTRTPYNKSVDDTNVLIALLGYAYAMQDMRGRYASDGVYLPMYSDAWSKTPYHSYQHILDVTSPTDPATANAHEDGYHSVQYLANQLNNDFDYNNDGTSDPLFNGSIGMFGASALGNTQYQAAAAHKIDPNGPGLKSLLPIVATNEHYLTTGFKNGVYRQSLVSEWLKGQLRDMDDVIGTDNALQNNQHTPFDYSQTNETAVIELGT